MSTKRISFAVTTIMIMLFSIVLYAQEKPADKKSNHMMMQDKNMQECMDKIASDEHMRSMMMQKMMEHVKSDSTSMMQMCKMMMDNPEMHKMMMKMMHGDKGMMDDKMMKHDMMKSDSTKAMKESEHEKHHKK